jgi:hypothetical protein
MEQADIPKGHHISITEPFRARRRSDMPVRSLSSSVLRWPKRSEVDAALRLFAVREARRRPDLILLGYFGSYARDDAGVGSDLDIVAVLQSEDRPFERRGDLADRDGLGVRAKQRTIRLTRELESNRRITAFTSGAFR